MNSAVLSGLYGILIITASMYIAIPTCLKPIIYPVDNKSVYIQILGAFAIIQKSSPQETVGQQVRKYCLCTIPRRKRVLFLG